MGMVDVVQRDETGPKSPPPPEAGDRRLQVGCVLVALCTGYRSGKLCFALATFISARTTVPTPILHLSHSLTRSEWAEMAFSSLINNNKKALMNMNGV